LLPPCLLFFSCFFRPAFNLSRFSLAEWAEIISSRSDKSFGSPGPSGSLQLWTKQGRIEPTLPSTRRASLTPALQFGLSWRAQMPRASAPAKKKSLQQDSETFSKKWSLAKLRCFALMNAPFLCVLTRAKRTRVHFCPQHWLCVCAFWICNSSSSKPESHRLF
jgi:hypothetical protein